MSYTSITVTGTYAGGTTADSVVFELTSPMRQVGGSTISPVPIPVNLDGSGSFSVALDATNDPATLPVGVAYQVTVRVGTSVDQFYVIVPYDAVGGTIDITELTRVLPTPYPDNNMLLASSLGQTVATVAALSEESSSRVDGDSASVSAAETYTDTAIAAAVPGPPLAYQGTWNASTNTPTLADGTGTEGFFYQVSVGGSVDLGSGSVTFAAQDWVLYTGGVWTHVVGPGETLPWVINIDPFLTPSTETTWTTIVVSTTSIKNGYIETFTQSSQLGWDVILGAGTWDVALMVVTNSGAGIITVAIDGVSVGTIDCYTSGSVPNTVKTLTGIAVATSGKHRVTLTNATKNASSSGYGAFLSNVQLLRTA